MTKEEEKAAWLFNNLKKRITALPLSVQFVVVGADNYSKLPAVAQTMLVKLLAEYEAAHP